MRLSPPPSKGSHDSNRLELNALGDPSSRNDEESQLLHAEDVDTQDNILPRYAQWSTRPSTWSILNGPNPSKVLTIRPILPAFQRAPVRWLASKNFDRKKILAVTLLLWFSIFVLFLRTQLPQRDGSGKHVINLDCTDTLWRRKNECGLQGIDCRPFTDKSFAFKCPAQCLGVRLLNPRIIGSTEVNYRPLVIGNGTYRGDSFICGSAIHVGVVADDKGGCGRVNLVGQHTHFASTKAHGIDSIGFDSPFPLSFTVASDNSFRCQSDPRSVMLPISLLITAGLVIFSTSPIIFFPIFIMIFAHVAFFSDPPQASFRNITVLPDHISRFAKRLLPASFIAIFMYKMTIERTLAGLTAQYEKAFFWLGGFWIGALSNYTFEWIPISRLTAHDLNQQPGAKLALALIILLIVAIVVGQAYHFWVEGRLLRYLGLYGLLILGILICLVIPGVNLRIHHYILAMLFLPGTSLQTRPSLFYQGLLLGLFVNGVARWDFDSILQTSDALRADAQLQSVIPASVIPVLHKSVNGKEITAEFMYPAPVRDMDGISLLVNDVEQSREYYESLGKNPTTSFDWKRPAGMLENEYVRWAYVKDGKTLDYSKPGILGRNGEWTTPDGKVSGGLG